MQNTELNGRQIDVHYSLPKEEERKAKCDRDKNQVCMICRQPRSTKKNKPSPVS